MIKVVVNKVKNFCVLFIAAIAILNFGCAPLTKNEEIQYAKLLNDEIVSEPISKKSKITAATLSFLIPGVGHFYLGEWGSGTGVFLSNIFWPLSPFWATPTAVEATENINKRHTVEYFTLGEGKKVVAKKNIENCFKMANEYILVQKQNGKNDFTSNEVSQFLLMQNCTPETVKNIDWKVIESKTDTSFRQI